MRSIYKLDKQEDLVPFPSSKSMESLTCVVKSSKRASNEIMRLPIKHNLAVGGCGEYLTSEGKALYFTQK